MTRRARSLTASDGPGEDRPGGLLAHHREVHAPVALRTRRSREVNRPNSPSSSRPSTIGSSPIGRPADRRCASVFRLQNRLFSEVIHRVLNVRLARMQVLALVPAVGTTASSRSTRSWRSTRYRRTAGRATPPGYHAAGRVLRVDSQRAHPDPLSATAARLPPVTSWNIGLCKWAVNLDGLVVAVIRSFLCVLHHRRASMQLVPAPFMAVSIARIRATGRRPSAPRSTIGSPTPQPDHLLHVVRRLDPGSAHDICPDRSA